MTPPKAKPAKLEIANEMYKFAVTIKREKFAREFPGLDAETLRKKTMDYFLNLPKDR